MERRPASRGGSRGILYAGIGAAAIGVIAIVAVLLSNTNGPTSGIPANNTTITPPASHSSKAPESATRPATTASYVPPRVNLVPTPKTSPSKSLHPTTSRSATTTKTGTATATSTATGTGGPTGSGSPTASGGPTGSGGPTDSGSPTVTPTS